MPCPSWNLPSIPRGLGRSAPSPGLADLMSRRHCRLDLAAYLPQPLLPQVEMAVVRDLLDQELRELQSCSTQEAQIGFIGGSGAPRNSL